MICPAFGKIRSRFPPRSCRAMMLGAAPRESDRVRGTGAKEAADAIAHASTNALKTAMSLQRRNEVLKFFFASGLGPI